MYPGSDFKYKSFEVFEPVQGVAFRGPAREEPAVCAQLRVEDDELNPWLSLLGTVLDWLDVRKGTSYWCRARSGLSLAKARRHDLPTSGNWPPEPNFYIIMIARGFCMAQVLARHGRHLSLLAMNVLTWKDRIWIVTPTFWFYFLSSGIGKRSEISGPLSAIKSFCRVKQVVYLQGQNLKGCGNNSVDSYYFYVKVDC